jgi:hypothetical protein
MKMRTFLAVILAVFAAVAAAQSTERPKPPGTSPLEAPPPLPPASLVSDKPTVAEVEAKSQVTTRTEGDETIQEYRVGGKVFMTRVTPKHGKPYVLIDQRGDGTFTRMDILEPGLRAPQWTLFEF